MLSAWSLIAVAVMVAAVGVALSKRFLAVGALVLANIVVHVLTVLSSERVLTQFGYVEFSVVRQELALDAAAVASAEPIAALQLFTHMFLHADIFHLIGNLIVLLAFALPFEERIGARPMMTLYLLSGLAAAFAQMSLDWGVGRMVGASGAVFGIIGAFAAAYPRLVIPLPLPLMVIMIFVRMRVLMAAIAFATVQILMQYLSAYNPGDNTAYMAHIGGLGAGLAFSFLYVRLRRTEDKSPRIDVSLLTPFAIDDRGREALARLRQNIDEPDVFEAWMERFLDAARSPSGASLALRRGYLVSTRGERFDVRVQRRTGQTDPLRS